ncbi:MAG: carbohydrate porin [Myxococcales bacterium]|nr:carbohydrate porin [Myxococcales bacterium]
MATSKLQPERWLGGLASLLLLTGFSPSHAQGVASGGAVEVRQQQDAAAPSDAGPDLRDSDLGEEVRADGSRLFEFHPIWDESEKLKRKLHAHGVTYSLEMAFYDQYASSVAAGQRNFGTYSWRLSASWRFLDSEKFGSLFLDASLLGSPGLNYDPSAELITRNVGSISELNGNIYPDAAALDEVLIKYVSPSTRYGGAVGKIDLANRFDTNRVANDAFREFTSFALQNNLSIPWPVYGGIGAFLHADIGARAYVMAATATSVVEQGFDFGQQIDDGNLYQLAEIGLEFDLPSLGTGHYRLTPWHSRILDRRGWGVGFNFDQELFHPDVIGFFRFGIGERSVTPVQTFVSGGVGWLRPWGRPHDMFGVGVAWSNPSRNRGFRNETLVEIFYRLSILPWFQLSPDLQVVYHPANDRGQETVVVPGIRLNMSF